MTTNHIIILQWHIPEFMRKRLMLTFKDLKQRKLVDMESRVYRRMANFGDYPGDFIFYSGDREIRSKIWSLLD